MTALSNTVSLVVDKNYGNRLDALTTNSVWIIDTPINRMAVEAYRQLRGDAVVTTFKNPDSESPEAACLNILGTIELHHGKFSDGYSVLEVIGASLDDDLRFAISDLGFSRFESTPEGFRATR